MGNLIHQNAANSVATRKRSGAGPLMFVLAVAVAVGITNAYASTLPGAKNELQSPSLQSPYLQSNEGAFVQADSSAPKVSGYLAVNDVNPGIDDEQQAQMEEKYKTLPPLNQAKPVIEGRPAAKTTIPEKMLAGAKSIANNITKFVPSISSSVRYDDIREKDDSLDATGNRTDTDYSTVLASINPTFLYETRRRKWELKAQYDYGKAKYFVDDDRSLTDHLVNVNWTRRLKPGQRLNVAMLYQNTHDRNTTDPIQDFDSALDTSLQDYDRNRVTVTYLNGTPRSRTRYEAFVFRENSNTDYEDRPASAYDLARSGIGGEYDWQIKRQMTIVAEARYDIYDYALNTRDNTLFSAMIGADVSKGRRIRAKLRVGYAEKTLDKSIAGDSFSEPVFSGTLEWDLRRTTSVQMETGRGIYELPTFDRPNDTSKFNIQNWIGASWAEKWSSKLSTVTSYTYRFTTFEGRDGNEDAQQFVVSTLYDFRRNLTFAIDTAYTKIEDDLRDDTSRRTITLRTDYRL